MEKSLPAVSSGAQIQPLTELPAHACCLHSLLMRPQALNGTIAELMFNIVYEVLLARKLRWYAMCPVMDAMNHDSTVQVGGAQNTRGANSLVKLMPTNTSRHRGHHHAAMLKACDISRVR